MQYLSFINPFLTSLIVSLTLSACSQKSQLVHIEGFAQGTTYHITYATQNAQDKSAIEQAITDELDRLDKSISNYRDDSDLELFNALTDTEPHEVSQEIIQLVETARAVHKASRGCYDLTIKPLFELWGFKKNDFNVPGEEALQKARSLVNMNQLETIDQRHLRKHIPALRVDLSSIGQGYSVGKLSEILEAYHIENYLVEIGGELKARGKKPDGNSWRIALEKPLADERKLDKIVVFASGEPLALMTSGTYRHYFDKDGKRYSHILDARTAKPVAHTTLAVSVLHPDPATADAWSTALLCLGSREGTAIADEHGIAALYIDQVGDKLVEKNTAALQALTAVSFESPNRE